MAHTPEPRTGVDPSVAGPLLLMHSVGLGLAPFTFSWEGLWLCLGLYLAAGLGVTAGAHRYFTHRCFEATHPARYLLLLMFLLSGQGSPLRWTRDHLVHHNHSDADGDPHSPHHGGFWYAQLWWLWQKPPSGEQERILYFRYARRLARDPWLRRLHSGAVLAAFHGVFMLLLYFFGWLHGGAQMGLSLVVYSALSKVLVLHSTSLVNSATHLWGYRNYETDEESRNLWWVALLTLGEGWHNNHHRYPAAANNGFHRWWEIDITFLFILALATLGLVHNVKVLRAEQLEVWFYKARNTS